MTGENRIGPTGAPATLKSVSDGLRHFGASQYPPYSVADRAQRFARLQSSLNPLKKASCDLPVPIWLALETEDSPPPPTRGIWGILAFASLGRSRHGTGLRPTDTCRTAASFCQSGRFPELRGPRRGGGEAHLRRVARRRRRGMVRPERTRRRRCVGCEDTRADRLVRVVRARRVRGHAGAAGRVFPASHGSSRPSARMRWRTARLFFYPW